MTPDNEHFNTYVLSFFVILGAVLLHFFPESGREMSHDALIALLALMRTKSTPPAGS